MLVPDQLILAIFIINDQQQSLKSGKRGIKSEQGCASVG
jgi:hypothetical protein